MLFKRPLVNERDLVNRTVQERLASTIAKLIADEECRLVIEWERYWS
jgi:hypothetical protein